MYAPVRMVGVVGDDFRDADLDRFRRHDIDVDGIERRGGRSFRWLGRYDYGLNAAETINTDLGVFGDWRPHVPARFAASELVFLANIHPEIQLLTLEQMRKPALVALDTMNFWIEKERDALVRVIGRVDVVSVNEAEVRQLADTHSVFRAAKKVLALGPRPRARDARNGRLEGTARRHGCTDSEDRLRGGPDGGRRTRGTRTAW